MSYTIAVILTFYLAVIEAGERNEHFTLPTILSLPMVNSSSSCLHESVSSGHLACAARGKSSKKRRSSSSRLQLPQRQMSEMTGNVLPKAEVLPLQVPSANLKFPIAPDGKKNALASIIKYM